MVVDCELCSLDSPGGAVDVAYPVVHVPVYEGGWVVGLFEDLHVGAVDEVVGEDAREAAVRAHDAVRGPEGVEAADEHLWPGDGGTRLAQLQLGEGLKFTCDEVRDSV